MRDFDDMTVNGAWNTCPLGHRWSESDGGPCHWECSECGKVIGEETCDTKDHELCVDCAEDKKACEAERLQEIIDNR